MGRAANHKQQSATSPRRGSVETAPSTPSSLPRAQLESLLQQALARVAGREHEHTDPLLRRAKNTLTTDYQANIALSLGKLLSREPMELAQALASVLATSPLLESVDVSAPGFINLRLNSHYLEAAAATALADARLGVPLTSTPQRTILDYSGPNVAKEMHVGHLRSTVIGDALARVLAFAGHDVVRQNHLGDWGTQFGMLVEHMIESERSAVTDFKELGALYRESKQRYDNDGEFAQRARARVVALQSGDEQTTIIWESLVNCSRAHMRELYTRLGVTLDDSDIKGESFYNDRLDDTIEQLQQAGVASTSEGALVVFSQHRQNKDGTPTPLLVRKSDGGYLYGTTDLAALRHRLSDLKGERLIYVVDARQSQHFELVFEAAERANWLPANTSAVHVQFGSVLGDDGRPLKTRAGDNVPLEDLLDEAVVRARAVIDAKNPQLSAHARENVAEVVAIGAIKYADLNVSRQRDYVFSFDHMLALEGNTAPYLQYAHVRATSIARKAKISVAANAVEADIIIGEDAERTLALKALEFAYTVDEVATTLEPHRLCTYLYELANTYMSFYEQCPVLSAEPVTQRSRLALSQLAADVLAQGLDLLGIGVPAAM
jgi:arginyl-tRNA synthetase